jgi:hypothetical protein
MSDPAPHKKKPPPHPKISRRMIIQRSIAFPLLHRSGRVRWYQRSLSRLAARPAAPCADQLNPLVHPFVSILTGTEEPVQHYPTASGGTPAAASFAASTPP